MNDEKYVNLDDYATQYDLLSRVKPSYNEVMDTAKEAILSRIPDERDIKIGDFGAGTGELTKRLSADFPLSEIYAVELSEGFMQRLTDKIQGYGNVHTKRGDIEINQYGKNYFDAIAMIHVLNFTKNAKKGLSIQQAYEQLKPEGFFVIADIGRPLSLIKHGIEMFWNASKQYGLKEAITLYKKGSEVIKANRIFAKNQKKGIHPMHTLEELSDLVESKGFTIVEARNDLYLGDDDFIVARK